VHAVALTVLVFSLLVWSYVIVIQVTHPDWLPVSFSHVQYPPFDWRMDDIGMLAFAFAVVGFFVWQIERGYPQDRHAKTNKR